MIGMCEDNKRFGRYGSAFPMFFKFIKFCIYLLIIMFLITGIVNLYNNNCMNMNGGPGYCVDAEDSLTEAESNVIFLLFNFSLVTSLKDKQDDTDTDTRSKLF
jgi:hypothetical protein